MKVIKLLNTNAKEIIQYSFEVENQLVEKGKEGQNIQIF